jgi:hypothetical protein
VFAFAQETLIWACLRGGYAAARRNQPTGHPPNELPKRQKNDCFKKFEDLRGVGASSRLPTRHQRYGLVR